jgi:hypothetical protein
MNRSSTTFICVDLGLTLPVMRGMAREACVDVAEEKCMNEHE